MLRCVLMVAAAAVSAEVDGGRSRAMGAWSDMRGRLGVCVRAPRRACCSCNTLGCGRREM